jgi:hypothetical protein
MPGIRGGLLGLFINKTARRFSGHHFVVVRSLFKGAAARIASKPYEPCT